VNGAKNSTATGTTATAEPGRRYVGRFAPSPTGDLHLGSLYCAAASFLDARAHGGDWLVRMEDLDRPREIPGAADRILATLEAFGFEWDGEVIRQSTRLRRYDSVLGELRARGLLFECSCSRLELADEDRYPGHCRQGPLHPERATATRLRVEPRSIAFTDRVQGRYRQEVASASGDLILKRRDGLFAYVFAVVLDDAAQGVTHVTRGADLLDNTPPQIYLHGVLELSPPAYAHVPVLTESDGEKLAKSRRSVRADSGHALATLIGLFELLNLSPPVELLDGGVREAWSWAIRHWKMSRLPRRLTLPAQASPD
jgi:glutamyl-Q tRNA(Asp) synthetase